MRVLCLAAALLLSACVSAPKGPIEELKAKGLKRYVVWNKKQFIKPAGQVTMSATTILNMAKAMKATDVQALDKINGFTITAPEKAALTLTSGEWQVQEEIEYHTMQTLYKIEAAQCPVNPSPTCPAPTPCPNPENPNPNPNPTPIEPAKSWGITRVRANEAKQLVDTSKVKVCVIDTGIDLSHPNRGNVVASIGYAGAVQDRQGHGTHTAGTVAGLGGVGVSRAQLQICKGLSDSGSGSSAQLAQCLVWCGQQGAHIVSNSWGSSQSDALINQAIAGLTAKGIYVFVANGNDSGPVNWPARLAGSNPLVYAVAASDSSDRITGFSSRGPETRYISPGAAIVSNWPGGGVRTLDGTSMATPHAAAICAFGVAKGIKPCIKTSGVVGGYPFADALSTVQ